MSPCNVLLVVKLLGLALVIAAVAAPSAAATDHSARWFKVRGGNVNCELGLHRPHMQHGTYVWCLAYKGGAPAASARAVNMLPSGKLAPCRGLKCIGNAPKEPTLKVGHSLTFGPFRCTALRDGVRCVVTKLGHGFVLRLHSLKRL